MRHPGPGPGNDLQFISGRRCHKYKLTGRRRLGNSLRLVLRRSDSNPYGITVPVTVNLNAMMSEPPSRSDSESVVKAARATNARLATSCSLGHTQYDGVTGRVS